MMKPNSVSREFVSSNKPDLEDSNDAAPAASGGGGEGAGQSEVKKKPGTKTVEL
ncbi:hypothetical protein INS49_006420 [Diaporthe citri]|uniref:uncharacterized protein n=1 Tax=Diaporthe citri TaxID=83186 RepID=UPI001C8263AB|nr:uncharacterized protein INS49_006420 [Diaporthe citri]KAG6364816.1 hypothetical protein INS49_006420 [Diaporthe citri]